MKVQTPILLGAKTDHLKITHADELYHLIRAYIDLRRVPKNVLFYVIGKVAFLRPALVNVIDAVFFTSRATSLKTATLRGFLHIYVISFFMVFKNLL